MKKYINLKNVVTHSTTLNKIVCDKCQNPIPNGQLYIDLTYSEYGGFDIYDYNLDICKDCAKEFLAALYRDDDVDNLAYKKKRVHSPEFEKKDVIDFREEINKSIQAVRDIKFLLEGSVELVPQDIDVAIQECAKEIKHLETLIQVYDSRLPIEIGE